MIKSRLHPEQSAEDREHERAWMAAVRVHREYAAAFKRVYGLPRSVLELIVRYR